MTRPYPPIRDYALIGDGHTAALVSGDGSVDWCCLPHLDSPAVFCRLLDAAKGGWFRVGPAGEHGWSRSYLGDTNVLATVFTTSAGTLRVTDLMPVEARADAGSGDDDTSRHDIVRLVEGLAGEVELEVAFRPSFDYARAAAEVTTHAGGAVARAGGERLTLACPLEFSADGAGALVGRARVAAGDRFWISLTYDREVRTPPRVDLDAALAETLAYWRRWSATCTYDGPYHPLVRRSALALKLLTFAPSGALVAAPTTSLPEEVGGVRNWDYRYTWLRDSALILYALQSIGYHAEADAFFAWLERLCLRCRGDLRIMYTLEGWDVPAERTLDHLEGYRGSRPVRIGNAAAAQTQLDIFGEVLDAAHLHLDRQGAAVDPGLGDVLRLLADRAAARWREPDEGIWEVRGPRRHFLYSKLLCWVALDRALLLAGSGRLGGDLERWRREREAIRRAILEDGYDGELGAFTQALGEPILDASALAVPLVGFLPATDARVRSTVARIRERLTADGLVYRYLPEQTADGLPGGEATFALCSFWLVDNLALDGRLDEARELFERVAGYANDVGLLAEEIEPASGDLLGNHPQGFTHLALIRSALSIAKTEASGAEQQPETPAERGRRAAAAGRGQGG